MVMKELYHGLLCYDTVVMWYDIISSEGQAAFIFSTLLLDDVMTQKTMTHIHCNKI